METIGKRIKERREQLGITQEELAFAIESDQQQVWRYESGKGKPSADKLIMLAKALNISVDHLLGTNEYIIKNENDLNDQEKKLIKMYREKDPESQEKIIQMMDII